MNLIDSKWFWPIFFVGQIIAIAMIVSLPLLDSGPPHEKAWAEAGIEAVRLSQKANLPSEPWGKCFVHVYQQLFDTCLTDLGYPTGAARVQCTTDQDCINVNAAEYRRFLEGRN